MHILKQLGYSVEYFQKVDKSVEKAVVVGVKLGYLLLDHQ